MMSNMLISRMSLRSFHTFHIVDRFRFCYLIRCIKGSSNIPINLKNILYFGFNLETIWAFVHNLFHYCCVTSKINQIEK